MAKKKAVALKTGVVRQSVALTEATYDLSRDERRVVYLAAIQCAQSDSGDQQIFPITDYEIKCADYAAMFEVDAHESSRDVRLAIKSIYEKSVIIPDPDASSDTEASIEEIRWIIGKKNLPRRGSWQITLNPLIVPHLTDLANRIKYPIGQIIYLQNTYQYRLYELFIAEPNGVREIEVDWLREKFCLNDKKSYQVYANLRQRIIDPAIKQINETTPMKISYIENKVNNKKVVSWTFTYSLPKTKK
ncbi:MAG: plasmid replication initiation protein [Oleiphilaceae bacterium]|jgi:plasmid replication initiation protein